MFSAMSLSKSALALPNISDACGSWSDEARATFARTAPGHELDSFYRVLLLCKGGWYCGKVISSSWDSHESWGGPVGVFLGPYVVSPVTALTSKIWKLSKTFCYKAWHSLALHSLWPNMSPPLKCSTCAFHLQKQLSLMMWIECSRYTTRKQTKN